MQEIEKKKSGMRGEVPEAWEILSLGEICKITSGGTPSRIKKSYWDGNIPWITTSEINFNTINCANQYITIDGLRNSSAKLFPVNTLLVALYGQGVTRGKCAVLGIEASTNQACAALIGNENLISTKFLFQYLSFNYSNLRELSNSGGQENLSGGLLKSFKILLPPLPEQQAIADCLSTWDGAIQVSEQLIAQKELQKKWLMQQLLTGKKRLKGFGEEWREVSYSSLLKIVKRDVIWSESELYKLISVRRRSGGIFFREALFGNQIKVKNLRNVEVGDFLFSKMQIVHGASALVTNKFEGSKISGSYTAVIAKNPKDLNMEYFNWCSKLPYFYHQALISSYGVHIEKMTFNFESFLQLEMTLPSIAEQQAIASILSESDRELDLLRERLQKIREQKKGLMQVLLTGKRRLKINF